MKKVLLVLLLSLSAYSLESTSYTSLSGGLALAVGEGSDHMNPGVSACIEPIVKFANIFGIGGHVDYTWLSADNDWKDRAGMHNWDVGPVFKLFAQLNESVNIFAEIDPALNLTLAYASFKGSSETDFDPNFGLTFGAGFTVNRFIPSFKFRTIYIDGQTVKWITLNIGVILE
jgi:hypothetical protein